MQNPTVVSILIPPAECMATRKQIFWVSYRKAIPILKDESNRIKNDKISESLLSLLVGA